MTGAEHLENNDLALLRRLNEDLAAFIRRSVEASVDFQAWSALPAEYEPIKCWETKGCSNRDCPAYGKVDYRCWLQVGTLCGGTVQGEFAKKYTTCVECEVMKGFSREPVRALHENIHTLICHLNEKTARINDLAIKDQLTDLYNRHFFNEIFEKETAQAERRAEPLSFIMIDIDGFKRVNDAFGHLVGDRLLAETATLIKTTVRKSDLVFRYGGDEFLVMLVNADRAIADTMVRRILDGVDRWNKDGAGAFGYPLSLSVGYSTYEKGHVMLEALKAADADMYRNKRAKRKAGDSR